jgi:hypothetical protein
MLELSTLQEIPDIEPTVELDHFVRPGGLRSMVFAGQMQGPAQLPLFDESGFDLEIVKEHYEWPSPPEVRVYAVSDHVLGGGGLLERNGCVWLPRDCFPAYLAQHGPDQSIPQSWTGALNHTERQFIDLDVAAASPLHPNMVYGHFLLEMVPRLYLLRILRNMGLHFKVVLERSIPSWAQNFISIYFPPDEIVWYDGATDIVRAPVFIVPGMMHIDHNLHPMFNQVVEDLTQRAVTMRPRLPIDADTPQLIHLSRRRLAGPVWHKLENESEIEDGLRSLGFRIVHPQELSFVEQIRLFEHADCIVSEYSSALHNSLFARRKIKVVAFNRINWYQGMITRLRGQRLAYIPPEDGIMRDWRWLGQGLASYRINPRQACDTIARFLGS